VLILDNVDDADFLLKPQTTSQEAQEGDLSSGLAQPLFRYLPPSGNGSILITTRSRNMALKLVEENNIIPVEPMGEGQALALFETKLGKQSDKTDIAELAAALEFIPLAIAQAAAYIKERAPRCSVRQYIEKFQKGDKAKSNLLNHDAGHLRRDWEAKNSIIKTWQISFDHISQTRRSAADLLSLMSFFDRQGIPEALIRNQSGTGNRHGKLDADGGNGGESDAEDSVSEAGVNDEFEDDILTLRNYSFISLTTDVTTFEMHGLVQLATRKWMESQGQLEGWRQQYIKNLCTEFPTGQYENWPKCQAFFPHAKSVLAQQPEGEESLREWAWILYNAAWYAWARGSSIDAEKMSIKSMKVRKKLLGEEHNNTLSSMAMVALAYNLEGRWKEAKELQVQVMETSARVLGAEHPDTLTSMANLASTYRNQGRWKEAEELQVQVMETRKRVLGAEHPSTLTSMANLASTFWNQGRWKEAEELEVQVMETSARVLGAEHPDTLTSMNNLAFTFKFQCRNDEAIALLKTCLQLRKQILGPQHPNTESSLEALNEWQMENMVIEP
jgi:Tetratricopeptide repeat